MYQLCLVLEPRQLGSGFQWVSTSGAVIKLGVPNLSASDILRYLKRKASLLSSKASLHDYILHNKNPRKPWIKD